MLEGFDLFEEVSRLGADLCVAESREAAFDKLSSLLVTEESLAGLRAAIDVEFDCARFDEGVDEEILCVFQCVRKALRVVAVAHPELDRAQALHNWLELELAPIEREVRERQ